MNDESPVYKLTVGGLFGFRLLCKVQQPIIMAYAVSQLTSKYTKVGDMSEYFEGVGIDKL